MTAGDWLRSAEGILRQAGIATARLDAVVLLEDETGKDRGWLLAHSEFGLTQSQIDKLNNLLSRRTKHIPLAYLRGKTEFYGREFLLTRDVLVPRPETETMIDLLKKLSSIKAFSVKNNTGSSTNMRIADVGTGSGAVGITAKLELPGVEVDLLDIDKKALKVAKMNVDKFTLNTRSVVSDLLAQTTYAYDALLCNLPYVPDNFQINLGATHEPTIAIFGGPDGLDIYRELFKQLQGSKNKPLYILCESMSPQHSVLETIAEDSGYQLETSEDFIQVYRYADK